MVRAMEGESSEPSNQQFHIGPVHPFDQELFAEAITENQQRAYPSAALLTSLH